MAHYLVLNHGDGNNYFQVVVRFPFWGGHVQIGHRELILGRDGKIYAIVINYLSIYISIRFLFFKIIYFLYLKNIFLKKKK